MEWTALIGLVMTAGAKLFDVISSAAKAVAITAAMREELKLFRSKLRDNLSYVQDSLSRLAPTGFTPKALKILEREMKQFRSTAEDLFQKRHLKEGEVRTFQEEVMTTMQWRVTCAVFEVTVEMFKEQKAQRILLAQMLSMRQIQEQALVDPKLSQALSFACNPPHPTEAYLICLKDERPSSDVLTSAAASTSRAHSKTVVLSTSAAASTSRAESKTVVLTSAAASTSRAQSRTVVLTSAAASTSGAHSICKLEKGQKEVDESVKRSQKEETNTRKAAPIKEAQGKEDKIKKNPNRFNRDGAGKGKRGIIHEHTQKEESKMRKAALPIKEAQKKEEDIKENPNCSMSFIRDSAGKGRLRKHKLADNGEIEVTFQGPEKVVRAIMGTSPMKVSEKLRYFYFEVCVLELDQKSDVETNSAGVGVGLTSCEEFKYDKMAGWYKESFGYDGTNGNVYRESHIQEPFRMSKLAEGDTLGIGLLQRHSTECPTIFFKKNGELQGYTQSHGLKQSIWHLLHPVVTFVSCRAKIRVNFRGPFHLPSGRGLAAALQIPQ